MIVIIIAKSSKLCQHELIMIVCGPRVHTQFENHTCHAARGPSCHRHRLFPSCGFVRVTVQVTVWGGQLLVATRKNVITCDHTKQRRKRSFRRCFRWSRRPCHVLVLWNGFQCELGKKSIPTWLVWWAFESVGSYWLQSKATPQSSRAPSSPIIGYSPSPSALSQRQAGPLRCPVADSRLSVPVSVRHHKFKDSSACPQRDTSVRCGYHGEPKLPPQRSSSLALHSLLRGRSSEAFLVWRSWRKGFNFRLSGTVTRRRQRGEGNKGVALMACVEPRSSTASVCARAVPSIRALEDSP